MIVNVPTSRIVDNRFQPRMLYADVEDLAASILSMKSELKATKGLIQVPNGRLVIGGQAAPFSGSMPPDDDLTWSVELSVGHRRLRAFRFLEEGDADYATMPVNVIPMDDRTMDTLAWDENVARSELSAVEKARALQRTLDKFNLTQADLAKQRRMSPSAVSNALRLLRLPQALLDAIHEGKLSERHGVSYLPILDIPAADLKLANLTKKTNFGSSWERPTPDALAKRLIEIGDLTADAVRDIVERVKKEVEAAEKRAWDEQQRAARPAPVMTPTVPSAPVSIQMPPKSAPAADSGPDPDNEFEAEARQEMRADEAPAPQSLSMPPKVLPVIVVTIRIRRNASEGPTFTMSASEGEGFPQFFNGALGELAETLQHALDLFIPKESPETTGEQILMEMEVSSND